MLAHLSEECNTRQLAHSNMVRALKKCRREAVRLEILPQNEASGFFDF
jgi:hypothetical protein